MSLPESFLGDAPTPGPVTIPTPREQALRVKPWPDGRWRAEVNGAFRGWAASRREARQIAIQFARAQINVSAWQTGERVK